MIEWRSFSCQITGHRAPSAAGELHRFERGDARSPCLLAATFVVMQALLLSVSVAAAGEKGMPVFTANELGVSVTQWTVEAGLPTQDVRALAQTPDGFLWCGTSRGLVRFDGVKFKIYDGTQVPVLDGMVIVELAVDGEGRLWIVGQHNEVVVLQDGIFRSIGVSDGLPEDASLPRTDSRGDLWFKSGESFHQFKEGAFVPVPFPEVNLRSVVDVHFGSDGTAWVVLEEGQKLARIGSDRTPRFISELADGHLGRFFKMQNGSVGLISSRGVFKFHEGRWQSLHHGVIPGHQNIHENVAACEDPSENLWIGTYDEGLFVWLPDGRLGNFKMGSDSVTWIRAVICDAQGNVWVGKRDGLFRLRPTAFRNWAEESGMERSYVHSLAAGPDGTVWFANGWELSCLRPQAQRIERISLPVPADKTWRVHVWRDGTVWAGDLKGQLFRQVAGQMQMAGSVREEVTAIFDTSDGTLWAGSTEGLWRLVESEFKEVNLPAGDSPIGIRSMTEDSQGRLNVFSSGTGIIRLEGEAWRPVSGVPATVAKFIEIIHADREGNLWVTLATHGLGRLRDGLWSQFEILTPTGPAVFEGVAVDEDGYVWLPSNNGLFRVHQHVLTPDASRQTITEYREFDRNDGLGSVACTSIAYFTDVTGKGRVWVGTQNGAAVTDLKTLAERRERSELPHTLIEAVQWDDRPPISLLWAVKSAPSKEIAIPADVLRLRISYTATQVQFPEKATFQYRLLGLAEDWVQAGTERDATYFKLSPGRYQFQVRSANRHGDWNFAPALLGLRVLPAWWQMGWSRAGAGAVGAGLLWLAYARRMRRVKREQTLHAEFSRQLIRSQEQERKRIAGELHDSLGQNLLVAKNLALMGLNGDAANTETVKQFKDISRAVAEALSEARRISKALRPPELDRMGLTKALRGMVQRAGEASGIECRITMDDIDGLLPAAEEINVYRLVQEGMNNIVKHSKAGHADVQVLHHPDHLELQIADDGQGFDVGKARDVESPHTGTGLTGMEERSRLAGGEFEITSHVGNGTVVRIRIPVKPPKA